jgi:hypothetical protein
VRNREPATDAAPVEEDPWLTPGVRGIGAASFFADVGPPTSS